MSAATLIDVLRDRAASEGDRVVYTHLVDGEEQTIDLTFAALWRRACAIAAALESAGLAGERALLLYPPGLDHAPALFGCFLAGVVAVPEGPPDPRHPERSAHRLDAIAANARAAAVLTVDALHPARAALPPRVRDAHWLSTDHLPPDAPPPRAMPSPDALAYLQYTSGSTADPRGVMLSHRHLAANCEAITETYRPGRESVMVSWVPTFHDLGLVYGIAMPVFGGFRGVSLAAADFARRPIRWLRAIDRHRGTHSIAPDVAYAIAAHKTTPAERAGLDLSSWQMALNGAEPVRLASERAFITAFAPHGFAAEAFSHSWGLSEATALLTGERAGARRQSLRLDADALTTHRVRLAGAKARVIEIASCGTLPAATRLTVVDPDTRRPTPPDQTGEIWAQSPSIGHGYFDAPAASAETFAAFTADGDGPWLRTGDRGFVHEGRLFITGRIKDLIIIRGQNHAPQDLEASVEPRHPALRPGGVVAFAIEGADAAEEVAIVAELRPEGAAQAEAIYGAIRAGLADHGLRPARIALVPPGALPRTTSGKLQRGRARAMLLAGELPLIGQHPAITAPPITASAPTAASPTAAAPPRPGAGLDAVRDLIAAVLGLTRADVPADRPLAELGLDSVMLAELATRLEPIAGRALPITFGFDHPTPRALAAALAPAGDGIDGIDDTHATHDTHTTDGTHATHATDEIVIVALACRLPGGADSPEALWTLLDEGRDAIGDFPTDRGWPLDALYDPDPAALGRTIAPGGGFIDGAADFDPAHFGITPREARVMDPQQRILLELCHEAFERAGLDPTALAGSDTGVFIGLCQTDYARLTEPATQDGLALLGAAASVASGRIAYAFDLRGPALTVDTACSASLVALHQAAQAIRLGECTLALVGGATVHATPDAFITFSHMGALSPTGRSRAFGADADGAGWSEGAGVILLARRDEATRLGLPVLAVLRGSAVAQDGRSQGLTAPNGPAQARVIRRALAAARLQPDAIDAVEAHGTGTRLGDPIEATALISVFGHRSHPRALTLGSIKSNLGHTQAAAGIAGVIKMVLALGHGRIPATLHVGTPTPHVDWSAGAIALARDAVPWPRGARPRRAGISSFGVSGTNAHVVIEEAPPAAPPTRAACPVLLAGVDHAALRAQANRWRAWLAARPDADLDAITRAAARRAAARRPRLAWRAAITATDHAELCAALAALAEDRDHPAFDAGPSAAVDPIVFVVPGQGGQWPGMGRALYPRSPAFAAAIDACDAALAAETGWSVRAVICDPDARLDRTEIIQPCLFAMSVALAAAWRALGVEPAVIIGHSQGEIAAAVIAGHLSLADGARVVARRARLIEAAAPPGAMLALDAPPAEIERRLARGEWPAGLSLAVVNGATSTVVAGEIAAIDRLAAALAAEGRVARRIEVAFAAHSAQVDPLLPALRDALADLKPRAGTVTMISTVTGAPIDGRALTADYWCHNLRDPVRLDRALAALAGRTPAFVELGAHPVLALALADATAGPVVGSLIRDARDDAPLRRALGRLHVAGVAIDARRASGSGPLAALPTHLFRRQRYWIDDAPAPPERAERPRSMSKTARPDTLRAAVTAAVSEVTGIAPDALDPRASLITLGLDSTLFMQLKSAVRRRHGVDLPNGLFFEAGTSIESLSAHIGERLPPAPIDDPAIEPTLTPDTAPPPASEIARLMTDQLAALAELTRRQLDTLARLGLTAPAPSPAPPRPAPLQPAPSTPSQAPAPPADIFVPYRPIRRDPPAPTGHHLAELIHRTDAATPTSKARTDADRHVFANNRNIAGFTPATKELTYQIIADRAHGPFIWDLDGNRYIDLTMSFGASLLGHDNPLIADAIRDQMSRSFAVGPITEPAAGVARRISALTGHERVAFYNSGTEAVMVALRLARTATGRPRVVIFEGAYHGMFEGVLAIPRRGTDGQAAPMAPGVPESMVADTLVLPYDNPAALDAIARHGDTIAAVLVEPVQSRRPDNQPREFLHALRALTHRLGCALIFDEVVTGFRTGPDGAQGWFGVRADIATYGKVIGGGLPIGVVAGAARYLDGVDGGPWRFGDDSAPEKTNTFVAGTFCSHPLSMAAARAVLDHLADRGPLLHVELDARTRNLCARLNTLFADAELPIHTVQFGSLFRFVMPRPYELLYPRLLTEGIYIWEGRNCFLSTAHGDAEIDAIVAAVGRAAAWLAQAIAPTETDPAPGRFGVRYLPATAAQRAMHARATRPGGEGAYHVPLTLRLRGPLRIAAIATAVAALVHRHASLRTCFTTDPDGTLWQRVHPVGDWSFTTAARQPSHATDATEATDAFIARFIEDITRPFDLSHPGLVRCGIATLAPDDHLLVLDVHHLVCDGISIDLLNDELWTLYAGGAPPPPAADPTDFAAWERDHLQGPRAEADAAYWRAKLAGARPMSFPADHDEPERRFEAAIEAIHLADPTALRTFARAHAVTLHTLLAAIFRVFARAISGQDEICFGSPTAGRPDERFDRTVGLFIGVILHRAQLDGRQTFTDVLEETRRDIPAMLDAQHLPFERLTALLGARPEAPPFEIGFSYEASPTRARRSIHTASHALIIEPHALPPRAISMHFVCECHDDGRELNLRFAYNPRRHHPPTVAGWATTFTRLAATLIAAPDRPIDAHHSPEVTQP